MTREMNKQIGMDDKHVGILGLNDNYKGLWLERKNEIQNPTGMDKGLFLVR